MNPYLFPFLLTAYPLLHIAIVNPGQTDWRTVALTILVFEVATVALIGVLRLVFQSPRKAALGASTVTLLFYAYGPLHSYLHELLSNAVNQISGIGYYMERTANYLHPLLSFAWMVASVAALFALRRAPESLTTHLIVGSQTAAFLVVGLTGIQWVMQVSSATINTPSGRPIERVQSGTATEHDPDIYLIVLDGYARRDVLKKYYAFDNSTFLAGLEARGFHVADASSSNYGWTFLSLASLLNMQYLQDLFSVSPASQSRALVYDKVRDNGVAAFLRQRGYKIIHFQSTWGATLQNPLADRQVPCHRSLFVNEFYRTIAEASWLKAFQSKVSADLAECYLSHFNALASIGAEPGPKFVFVHFLPPHHPYLFDRNGTVLRDANLSNQFQYQLRLWEQREDYIEQLSFVNRQITNSIDAISRTSLRPPVIILQSDHGPNLTAGLSSAERHQVRLTTLFAIKHARNQANLIPGDLSSVNQFRYIFNEYFNEDFSILPNRHYFSEYGSPYDFTEVKLTSLH